MSAQKRPGALPEDLIAKAIAYAIVAISLLPQERQEAAEAADLEELLRSADRYADRRIESARIHLTGEGWAVAPESAA